MLEVRASVEYELFEVRGARLIGARQTATRAADRPDLIGEAAAVAA